MKQPRITPPSSCILLLATCLLTTRCVISKAQEAEGRITKRFDGKEVTARIYGRTIVTVVPAEGAERRQSVYLAVGEWVSAHPDFRKEPKVAIDAFATRQVESEHNPEIYARPAKETPDGTYFNHIKGKILLASIYDEVTNSSRLDDSPLYAPGAFWNVTKPILFGYTDKEKKIHRRLRPGRYRIGPLGEPVVVYYLDAGGSPVYPDNTSEKEAPKGEP